MAGLSKAQGGALARDTNDTPVQGPTAIVQREDTPLESPQTISNVAVEFVIPDNAAWLDVRAEGADLRFGDNSTLDGTANDGYDLIPAGTRYPIPVSSGDSVWFIRDAGVDVTAYFSLLSLKGK